MPNCHVSAADSATKQQRATVDPCARKRGGECQCKNGAWGFGHDPRSLLSNCRHVFLELCHMLTPFEMEQPLARCFEVRNLCI